MAKNNSEEIDFQQYVDSVKQKRMDWNLFVNVIKDISYSDKDRLRILNATLLNELTLDFSDMDKLKYLNMILLREFLNDIQKKHNLEMTQNGNSEKANAYEILNEDINNKNEENIVDSVASTDHEILNKGINIKNEDHLAVSCKDEIIERSKSYTNAKIFRCYICNKDYLMNFHLKQHIRNIHEKKKNNTIQYTNSLITQQFDENEMATNEYDKSIMNANNLKIHFEAIEDHEGHKQHKCTFCGKSFSIQSSLKMHIHQNHEGDKDHKCESCDKSFSTAQNLKNHIHTVHEGHKDYKCNSCGKSFSKKRTFEETHPYSS